MLLTKEITRLVVLKLKPPLSSHKVEAFTMLIDDYDMISIE